MREKKGQKKQLKWDRYRHGKRTRARRRRKEKDTDKYKEKAMAAATTTRSRYPNIEEATREHPFEHAELHHALFFLILDTDTSESAMKKKKKQKNEAIACTKHKIYIKCSKCNKTSKQCVEIDHTKSPDRGIRAANKRGFTSLMALSRMLSSCSRSTPRPYVPEGTSCIRTFT